MYATYNSCCEALMISENPHMELVWYKDGAPFDTTNIYQANSLLPGLFTTAFIATQPGLYEVFFINFQGPNFGCGKVQVIKNTPEEPVHQTATTGIETQEIADDNATKDYRIYPNPSSEGFFYFDYSGPTQIYSLDIYGLDGRKLFSVVPSADERITIQTFNYQPGLYIVQINSSTGITNEKILVK